MTYDRQLVVHGEGTVTGQPDRCILQAALNVMADTGPEAVARCSELANRVLGRLEEAGLASDQVRTGSVAVHDWFDQPTHQVTARACTYELTVTVDDLDMVGRIMGVMADSAGDSYQQRGLSLDIEDRAPLESQARQLAVRDAQTKANELAKTAGVALGTLLQVSDEQGQRLVGTRIAYPAAGSAGFPPPMPMAPGSLDVTARVTLVYAFETSTE